MESSERTQSKEQSEKLLKLLDHLRAARDSHGWDLANFCLERCTAPIEQIAASAVGNTTQAAPRDSFADQPTQMPASESEPLAEDHSAAIDFLDDLFLPTDALVYPWEMLWDNVEGIWHDTL